MRLIGLMLSILILALVMSYIYRHYFTSLPASGNLNTSYPAVQKQIDNMQEKVGSYDAKMKNYEDLINRQPVK